MLIIAGRAVAVSEGRVDEALQESFPASDPPPWTPSMARSRPVRATSPPIATPAREADRTTGGERVNLDTMPVDLPVRRRPVIIRTVRSAGDAIGAALLVGIGVLIVGGAAALVIRGVVEAIGSAFTRVAG